ncbi:arginase family protein [Streptomyces sp. NPDC088847]|uniref:arginase family protein n=1 Tax=Streptomyces sp. NPDC088847 TaxID=3365909 RepID=UPI0038307955
MRNFAIIEAPSVLGHIPTHLGVAAMPDALLNAGLADRLSARKAGRVESPTWREPRDPDTGIMNPQEINAYSVLLADAVGGVIDQDEFPIVIGGDCSIVLGTMLALRRRGRYGLLYIDGHTDFYQPEANPILGAASASDLAFATGRGPAVVADIESRGPLVRDDDVVAFGYRDGATQNYNRSQLLPSDLLALDRHAVRVLGTETAAEEAVAHLTRDEGPDGYWIHVDVDVLDQSIMWAVDAPQPDGFSWEDLATVLRVAMSSPRAIGFEITIYNPDMDPGGLSGRGLAATVGKALSQFANQ